MKRLLIIVFFISINTIIANQQEEPSDELSKKEPQKIEPLGTEKNTIDMINKIIKANQSFSVKISNPLLPGKMTQWQQRGIVRYPTKLTPWITFKKDIQQFGSHLHELLAKDPQSNSYYHLESLRKNHNLYKSLETIQQALAEYEPKIEHGQPFKLGKESLESMQKLINIYGTLFYQDKLLEKMTATLKSFDTKAKEIRTAQEQLQKKAQQGGKPRYDVQDFDESTVVNDSFGMYGSSGEYSNFDLDNINFDDDFVSSFFK